MPGTYRLVAEPTLKELEAALPPEELESARGAADAADLESLVSQALGETVRGP
jgi:hypothetical protein